jgi:phage-related protein
VAKRYDLGSVVGKITFDYDKNGVKRARDDMGRFVAETDEGGDHFDLFSKRSVKAVSSVASSLTALAGLMTAGALGLNVLNSVVVALVQMSGAALLLPGAFAGLAAVIGTVALGVDGIKKAFEGLKPTMDTLKSQVSAAFEKSLTPAVNNLKVVIPQLTSGFQQVARAIGDSATKFTQMLKDARSIQAVNNILSQTAGITRNLGSAAAPFVQAMLSIASIGLNFITPMTRGLEGLATKFNAWVQSAHGQAEINEMIRQGIAAFKLMGQIIGNVLGIVVAIFDGLSTSSGAFGDSLVTTLQAVKDFLQSAQGFNALQAIGQTLQNVADVVRTVLLDALVQIAPAIPPLMKAFSDLATQALPPLLAIVNILGPIIVKLAEAIADNINWIGPITLAILAWAAAQWLLNAALTANPIGLVITALALLAAAVALVITNWDTISAFFANIWNTLWKQASDKLTQIRDFIVGIWDGIVNWFSSLGNKIGSAFQSVFGFFDSVLNFFAELPGKIGSFLISLPGKLGALMLSALQSMLNAGIQGLEWLIAWAITLPIKTVEAMIGFGAMLVQWFTDAWNWFITTAQTKGAELIIWFLGLPGRIIDSIADMGDRFGAWIHASWDNMQAQADIKSAEFINWITGLPGRIIDSIYSMGERFGIWIRNAWDQLKNSAVGKWNDFIAWFRTLPLLIITALQGLGGRMVQIGGDIVRGIWQGIQNMASWLWSRVTDFVGGIVDKVKSILNIGSPSKVFADEVGQWIPAGIAQGIDNNAKVITDSLAAALNPDQVSKLITPMGKAAQEMLSAVMSDKTFFEDFSFKGQSALGDQFNEKIMDMFTPSTGDFSTTSRDEVAGFLRNLISSQTMDVPQTSLAPSTSSSQISIGNLNVAGNLDPTNPTLWRQTIQNLKDSIRDLERQYQ